MSMKPMDVAQAKRDFDRYMLTGFEIRDLGLFGFVVVFKTMNGEDTLTKARTAEPRSFKGVDAALRVVREVGFRASVLAGK